MGQPVNVAIIGCGWAGTRHAPAYARHGAVVRWVVDADPLRAEILAADHPAARIATDYAEALADPAVTAVDICLPHDLHAPVAVAAATAGKHVLVEKPLADTLDAADDIIAAADRAGVVLMVAESVRFSPLYRKVRDLLQAGAIGRPALIQMTRQDYLRQSFLTDRRWFLSERAAAGGIMMSGGVHDFETMRMLIGEIESVQALRARQRFLEMEGDDTSIALVRFQDGTVGTLVESFLMKSLATAAGQGVRTLRIDGDLGSLTTRDTTITLFSERPEHLPGGALTQHAIHVPEEDTFALEIDHFLRCIADGAEPITSGRSQRRPLAIVLAAYRSMATGLPVRLD
jgi:predicted dehydrogenase